MNSLVILTRTIVNPMPSSDTQSPKPSVWKLQKAKAQFSEVVDQALLGVPQFVTRRGKTAVVILSTEDYAALRKRPSAPVSGRTHLGFVELLLAVAKSVHASADDALLTKIDLQPRESNIADSTPYQARRSCTLGSLKTFATAEQIRSSQLAYPNRMRAYDAYVVQNALSLSLPLLTLDGPQSKAAEKLGVQLLESLV